MTDLDATTFEYGVRHVASGRVHRNGFTLAEAIDWIADWNEMKGKRDAFTIISRSIGPWVNYTETTA